MLSAAKSRRSYQVPGNFHVSTHAAGASQPPNPNMLHHIHSLTFGQNVASVTNEASFNSLQGRIAVEGERAISFTLM